ncbi:KAP family P-loop domain protein [compost metagenome]
MLTEHRSELVTNTEAYEFKKMFKNKKPLERIILYIDDLDRCPEERVVEVLEAVNLLLAFPLFVVIVGIDPRWVKIALKEKYKNQFAESAHGISPSNYLEKIFQVPFHLKDANDTTVKNMIEKLAKTTYNLDPIIQNKKSDVIKKESIEVSIVELDENDEQKITSTISIPESFEDEFHANKNKIEALNITNKEIQQIKSLAHIIGNNPRCIKRFLNIYRIVKTHEDFDYESYEKENELLVIMFLLALPMGTYNPLSTKINNLIESQEEDLSISYFLSKDYNTIEDELYKMKKNLNNFFLMDNSPLLKLKFNDLRKHYNFIKRFTFKNI